MGNIAYTKSRAASSRGKVAFSDSTLSITRSRAGSRAIGAVTPTTCDSGIRYWIVISIVYGDGNSGRPFVAL